MRRPGPRTADRGQAAVEYAGVITLLLLVAIAAIQLGLVAYAVQQAGTAARAGARAAAQKDGAGQGQPVGQAAMSDWLAAEAAIEEAGCGDEVTVTVTVPVPELLPVFGFDPARRAVTMPCD
ncbi:TadE family protein [Streptomyces jumonjinensis]|uniref:Pilus assembly protein n=1 Tax=Streptomyces jumonjinensis TaxID=1945 RepID=A0A646KQ62_STRJU|nr:TadE family protein [Streptomyces jumonjinensis]MQT04454.1 pilus assembly protein [Streptomyces jumonjinensis]